ncbi:MAG: VanZ family protein [Candidatus Omnitrophota bacterium]|jgi:VanZ family protein
MVNEMLRKKIISLAVLSTYIALIFSTLSVMPAVFKALRKWGGRSFDVTANSVMIALPVILLTVLSRRLKRNRLIVYTGILLIGLIYAGLIKYINPSIAEKVHLFEYGLLSYLALKFFDGLFPAAINYIGAAAVFSITGYCDELIQGILPNRVYDIRDVAMNVISGSLGLAFVMLLRYGCSVPSPRAGN